MTHTHTHTLTVLSHESPAGDPALSVGTEDLSGAGQYHGRHCVGEGHGLLQLHQGDVVVHHVCVTLIFEVWMLHHPLQLDHLSRRFLQAQLSDPSKGTLQV